MKFADAFRRALIAIFGAQHFDLDQGARRVRINNVTMKLLTDERSGENTSTSKPPRWEEARRTIEEYADDLREIIKKLRRKMN